MSDLQLSLIGVGVAAVLGVFAYNKWQERKQRKLAEQVFRSGHPDVLLGAKQEEAEPAGRIEPVLRSDGEAQEAVPPAAGEPPPDLIDPSIDCIVRFEAAEKISGGYLWQAQSQALDKLARNVVWAGLNGRSGAWERLAENGGGEYHRLRVALQLADRRGPLADGELTVFLNGVQRLADEFLAVAELPPRGEMLERAAGLDRFCAGVDIQIGVNVVANDGVFPGTRLRGLAEAAGLALEDDGAFHALDEQGRTLYTLSNLEPALFVADELKTLITRGVTLTLDLPRVADGAAAFERMLALARQLAESLGGRVVDDNRAPLADAALDVIRDKIAEIGQRMAGYGVKAGSPQALRLFS